MLKVIATFCAVVALLLGTIAAGSYYLLSAGCGNDVLDRVASPTGSHKAVVFQRDCGATTDFSTQVSVLDPQADLDNSAGNVFVADANQGLAPSGPGGGPVVTVQWSTPLLLVISHHETARVFKAESRIGAIEIRYEAIARQAETGVLLGP